MECLSALVPVITNGGIEEDHLRRAGDARGKFPLFQIDT